MLLLYVLTFLIHVICTDVRAAPRHFYSARLCGRALYHQHTIEKLFQLSQAAVQDPSLLPEAQRLQGIVARADFTVAKTGIAGTKALLEKLYGYGGLTRRPLPPIEPEAAAALWEHPHTQDIVRVERELSGKVAA